MSKPVNLNRFRKERDRVKKRLQSDENAVKYGLTKNQKSREKKISDAARRSLDGHKLEP